MTLIFNSWYRPVRQINWSSCPLCVMINMTDTKLRIPFVLQEWKLQEYNFLCANFETFQFENKNGGVVSIVNFKLMKLSTNQTLVANLLDIFHGIRIAFTLWVKNEITVFVKRVLCCKKLSSWMFNSFGNSKSWNRDVWPEELIEPILTRNVHQ